MVFAWKAIYSNEHRARSKRGTEGGSPSVPASWFTVNERVIQYSDTA